jgi:hypothetical protein
MKHVQNTHNPNYVAKQLEHNGNEIREISTYFNKNWSASKIEEAVNYGYNEAIKAGIKTGKYVFEYDGEMITVCLEDGFFETSYGSHFYSLDELLELLLGD